MAQFFLSVLLPVLLLLLGSSGVSRAANTFTNNIVDYSYAYNAPPSSLDVGPDGKIYCFWRSGGVQSVNPAGPAVYKLIRWNTGTSSWDSISSFAYTAPGNISTQYSLGAEVPMRVDSAGGFHAAFIMPVNSPSGNGIYYAYSANGSSWTYTLVNNLLASTTNDYPNNLDISVDSSNHPHIYYLENNVHATGGTNNWTGRVWTAWHWSYNGTAWASEKAYQMNGGTGANPNQISAMASTLDSAGKSHIALSLSTDGTSNDTSLAYITNTSGSWSAPTILAAGSSGVNQGNAFAITTDANRFVHIVRHNDSYELHYHTNKSGSFTDTWMNGSLLGYIMQGGRPLKVNAGGDVFLVCSDSVDYSVHYACLYSGASNWEFGTILSSTDSNTAANLSGTLTDSRLAMTTFSFFDAAHYGGASGPQIGPPLYSDQLEYATTTLVGSTPVPTVTSLGTTSGPTAGGTTVTITGTNLSGATGVKFGTNSATGLTNNTSTAITVTSPAGTGTVDITVTTAGGTSATSAADQFTYVAAPTVASVSSTKGNGSYNATVLVPITVTFSAPVTVTGTPTLALNSGGSATFTSGSGTATLTFNYTVGASDTTSTVLDCSSTTALALAGGTINATTGGTPATLTLPTPGGANSLGANKALVIDNTPPTITSIVRLNPTGQTTTSNSVTFRVTYSEPVTVPGASNFSVVAVNGSNIVGTVTAVNTVSGSPDKRDVTVSITSGTGEFRLRGVN